MCVFPKALSFLPSFVGSTKYTYFLVNGWMNGWMDSNILGGLADSNKYYFIFLVKLLGCPKNVDTHISNKNFTIETF